MNVIEITREDVLALVAAHVASELPAEMLDRMAQDAIETRAGTLTLEQVYDRLHLTGKDKARCAREWCRKYQIPIVHGRPPTVRVERLEKHEREHEVKLAPLKIVRHAA